MDPVDHLPRLQPVDAQVAAAELPTGTQATLALRPASTAVDAPSSSTAEPPQAVRFGSDVPSLRISTQGPDTLVVGKPADYLITLGNQSPFAARQVAVRIDLPSWVELADLQTAVGDVQRQPGTADAGDRLIWNVDEVAGGTHQTLTLSLVPRAGRAFDLAVDVSVRPSTSMTKIAVQEPKLHLQLQGDREALFGHPCRWTVAVNNPGTGDAHQVQLDVFSGSQKLATQPVGTLAAGTQRTVDLTLLSHQAGAHNIRVMAVAEPGLSAQAAADYQVRRAQLDLRLEGAAFEYAGTQSTYTLRVANVGDAPAHAARIQLALPTGASYLSGVEQELQLSDAGCSWTIGSLQPGSEQTWTIVCELARPGDNQLTVTADSEGTDTASADAVTRVQGAADLQLRVSDPVAPQATGGPVKWEITLTNRGSDAARDVYLVAVLPPEVELVDVTGSAAIESGEVFFQPIKQLAPGQTVVQQVTVRAREPGCAVFRVVAECDQPQSRLACEESTQFFQRNAAQRTASPLPIRKITIR